MSKNTAEDRLVANIVSDALGAVISPKFAAAARRLDDEAAHLERAHRVVKRVASSHDEARADATKLRKQYKRARRRLLELVVWQNPYLPLGTRPRDVKRVAPNAFASELQMRANEVAVTFDLYTESTVAFGPRAPKL